MPPVLSTLRDIDQRHAEKRGGFERPPIPFVPNASLLSDQRRHEVTLKVSPSGENGDKNNVIKKFVYVFGEGSPEDFLLWADDLRMVIERKPCKSAAAKFDLTELLLTGEALLHWKETVARICDTASKDAETGEAASPVGRTDDTYGACLALLKTFYFPKNAARIQKIYLRQHLRLPHELSVRAAAARLRDINGMIRKFPGRGTEPLPDDELADILVRMVPGKYRDMLRATKKVEEMTLHEVIDYFETLETMQRFKEGGGGSDKPAAGPAGGQRSPSRNRQRAERQKKKRGREQGDHSAPPAPGPSHSTTWRKWCSMCAEFGGRPDSHHTSQCRKWSAQEKRRPHAGRSGPSERPNKKQKKYHGGEVAEQLHLLKDTVKSFAKSVKKAGLKRHDSSSSSPSDSE
eukprot:CAMPEP_0183291700 /NCGR_PEP_ID=MMETSP0160_2-20130417/1018_1 /TAXON_ID=2839 ORGANISM="Odontella Sinensis, Strain Grunow 1884" /NCGR_SAMPLE_ID=MMETSP0160_2 /ASSEMBLY_ACC=CAM_ASM_000250 /LENGTH=403 /DNA_ID=CAMNT_0025452537 /DNA_START=256 /DNA_END=1467 /DNA_ORIENTATION=-